MTFVQLTTGRLENGKYALKAYGFGKVIDLGESDSPVHGEAIAIKAQELEKHEFRDFKIDDALTIVIDKSTYAPQFAKMREVLANGKKLNFAGIRNPHLLRLWAAVITAAYSGTTDKIEHLLEEIERVNHQVKMREQEQTHASAPRTPARHQPRRTHNGARRRPRRERW